MMNGKGDKYRVEWSKDYEDNYNKIFKENEMALIDSKGRSLQVAKRVCVQVDIPSENGMLYKNSIVKLNEWNNKTKLIRVTDNTGKVWWIEPAQVSCSFL